MGGWKSEAHQRGEGGNLTLWSYLSQKNRARFARAKVYKLCTFVCTWLHVYQFMHMVTCIPVRGLTDFQALAENSDFTGREGGTNMILLGQTR